MFCPWGKASEKTQALAGVIAGLEVLPICSAPIGGRKRTVPKTAGAQWDPLPLYCQDLLGQPYLWNDAVITFCESSAGATLCVKRNGGVVQISIKWTQHGLLSLESPMLIPKYPETNQEVIDCGIMHVSVWFCWFNIYRHCWMVQLI